MTDYKESPSSRPKKYNLQFNKLEKPKSQYISMDKMFHIMMHSKTANSLLTTSMRLIDTLTANKAENTSAANYAQK